MGGTYGCSNSILKWTNVLTLVLSIPIIAMGIWLSYEKGSECYTFLQKPVIFLGVAILVISIMGCVGAARSWSWLLWLYLFFMAILILLMGAFTLFAFIVTADGGGSTLANYKFKEYDLSDYSGWLQGQINTTSRWSTLRSCMVQDDYCHHLDEDYASIEEVNNATLNPLESGCCRPPVSCGFQQTNITSFTPLTSAFAVPDCARWQNNQTIMCYDCDSCKGGVAQYIRDEWRTTSVVLLVVLLLLSFLYCIGCCARYNALQPEFEDMEKERFAPGNSGAYPPRSGYQYGASAGYSRR